MTGKVNLWRCPACGHVMTEAQSMGYRGCPTGMHWVQHEECEEIDCPNCYGGHFRPCQMCGDTGRVINVLNTKIDGQEIKTQMALRRAAAQLASRLD